MEYIKDCNEKGIEESIEKMDLRKVSSEVREAIRKRGVAKIKSGKEKGKVAEMFDVPNKTVTNWWKRYSTEGNKGLKEKKRGRKSEDCKLLSDTQEVAIQKMHVATNAWPRRKIFQT